jgi:hypothetical protein
MKPCDWGEKTIKIENVGTLDGKNLTLHLKNLVDEENVNPESETDTAGDGELSSQLGMAIWVDDGDNVPEVGETFLFGSGTDTDDSGIYDDSELTLVKLKDIICTSKVVDTLFIVGETQYIGIKYHFQDHRTDNNKAQGDKSTFDIEFSLNQ